MAECHSDTVEVDGSSPSDPTRLRDIVYQVLADDGIVVGGDMLVHWDECHYMWFLGVNEAEAEIVMAPGPDWYRSQKHGYSHRIPISDPSFVNSVKQVLRGRGR